MGKSVSLERVLLWILVLLTIYSVFILIPKLNKVTGDIIVKPSTDDGKTFKSIQASWRCDDNSASGICDTGSVGECTNTCVVNCISKGQACWLSYRPVYA